MHVNKAKDEEIDQLKKYVRTVQLITEESFGLHYSITIEEVSEL